MSKNDDATNEKLLNEIVKSRQRKVELEKSESLRNHAERALNSQTADLEKLSSKDVQHLVHELQVHQIELEMQNEELRRAQNELEEARNRYSNLYDFAPIGYFTFDKNGYISEVNLTGANKLGVERSLLIKKPFSLYIAFSSRDVFYLHLRKVFKTMTRQTCEIKLVDKNKNQFDAQLESLAVQDGAGNFSQCRTAIIEITERKQVEEALRRVYDELELRVRERTEELQEANKALMEKEASYRELTESIGDLFYAMDKDLRYTYWNRASEVLTGISAKDAIGKSLYEVFPDIKGTKAEQFYIKSLRSRQPERVESEFLVAGKKLIFEIITYPTKNGFSVIAKDITEKRTLESQLLRSQRMESIGTLAGGMAHDLNNMLTPMMMSLDILKQKLKDENSRRLLNILENNSRRSADLVKQVLSFSRGIEGERVPLQAQHLITEIEKIAKETFPKDIEIRTDIRKDLFTISGDATQLHQVIINLCVNARDAMPDGGILNITTDNILIDENFARMHPEAKAGPYVAIAVSDTGTGIPPKILDRIFEPFFTTKVFGKGTGLGLSTSLAIVKSHGGFIDVCSEVGKGTTFRIYLPAVNAKIQNVTEQQVEPFTGHGELVLVVEDEASVREVTISILEKYGYKVLAANDGAEAVALYAKNRDRIKVILMDMMMPVMDGRASIHAIRKINPAVKVVVVSGLAEKDKLAKIESTRVEALLAKPYTAERLLKAMHEVISEK